MSARLVVIRRSFLLGRSAGDAVTQEQKDTLDMLDKHDLLVSGVALAYGTHVAYSDFMQMRSWLRAGGLHRVRLYGGRGIDG